jgi:phosphomannomutase
MMKEKVIIGGEESGGVSILGHIPEKDGILANLLIVEMVSKMKKPLSKILEELYSLVKKLYNIRINLSLEEDKKTKFLEDLKNNPPTLDNARISETKLIDGVKLIYSDGSWILARPSGTEPLMRIYCESQSLVQIDNLVAQAKKMI